MISKLTSIKQVRKALLAITNDDIFSMELRDAYRKYPILRFCPKIINRMRNLNKG